MKTTTLLICLLTSVGAGSAIENDLSSKFAVRFLSETGPAAHSPGLQLQASNAVEPQHLLIQRLSGPSLKQHWLQVASNSLNGVQFDSETPGDVNATRIKYLHSSQYVGNITVGSQEFQVVLDTGSSDTWIVHEGFTCIDYDNRPIAKSSCPFGPLFRGTFKYGTIPGVNFSIAYGDGELLHGPAGYDDVTIAGITVKKQQLGLASQVYGGGDGVTSGLLGLAYPILTQAFNGTNEKSRTPGSPGQRTYDPVFTSMVKQGLVAPPYFSMSMDRNNTGWLTLGGIPPVPHGRFSNAPIQKAQVVNVSTLATEYSFYTIVADDYVLGTRNASGIAIPRGAWSADLKDFPQASNAFPIVVDSGSTLASLPTAHAEAFAAQFSPPAVYNAFTAEYWAPCTAKVPQFAATIGGQAFYASPEDLLQQQVKLDWNGDGKMFCRVGVKDGYSGPFILGDVFLNSVIAVYDLSINEMHFAPRL